MPPPADADARFHTTQWTMVLAASAKDTHAADAALEALCRAYWFPLYAFARRSGKSPHDAQDLTQDFFAKVLEKNSSPPPTVKRAASAPS